MIADNEEVNDTQLTNWLMEQGGPVIRYRTARELMGATSYPGFENLLEEVLHSEEAQVWLGLRGRGPIHHGRDDAAENALAKLMEFGLEAGIPAFDEKALPLCNEW